ncbi:MAG: hypothetical protein QHC78_12240 [Pigmentiphaga sp.]|uniref:hypothetical protein n=1 Tax=Pigmentiphaga sp. TaxID=1977564 RepID=UPI0029A61292|nr:hypothetical protein [Pigmentiphaga sp.]MDX3906449.1 hypothetical protein [Pigmentiphaga sp.]
MKTPKIPDPNAGAPRPRHVSSEQEPRPDNDHPPGPRGPTTIFDQGTAQASEEARTGTLPGADDYTPAQRGQQGADVEVHSDGAQGNRTRDGGSEERDASVPTAGSGNTLGDGMTAGGREGVERRREWQKRVEGDAED